MYHQQLMCDVLEVQYNFSSKTGTIRMEKGNSVDMQAAIAYFQAIDPAVSLIHTQAGDKPDTRYRIIDGTWSVLVCNHY